MVYRRDVYKRQDTAKLPAVLFDGPIVIVDDEKRSEEHTSELQSRDSISYAVFKRGHEIIFSFLQEIKGDVKDPFTFAVVGHASYIPFSPLRLATMAYSPALASRAMVSSHVWGTWVMKRVHSSLR